MKKIYFFAVILFMMTAVLTSCGAKRQIAQGYPRAEQEYNDYGREMASMPCGDVSNDDANYFRDLGIGTAINMQSARTAALQSAKAMIQAKLGGFVTGIADSYARTVAGQAKQDKVQRMMEDEMWTQVEEYLNHAERTCEKMFDAGADGYRVFYGVQIPKKQLINSMADALSANEELEVEFNRERFRKFAEEKQKQMLEQRKNKNNQYGQ